MAHAYDDRRSFYGLNLHEFQLFDLPRDVHIQAPIIWIGVGWIGAGLFLAPAIADGRKGRGQGLLVDVLFWVTLAIVASVPIGNRLGIRAISIPAGSGSATRDSPASSPGGSGRSASSSDC